MTRARVATPVAPSDRVSDVLARDEALVEIFVRHSAHFEKLRNVAMRRVMARLVTVEQAARIASVPLDTLLRSINEALHLTTSGAPAALGATPDLLSEVDSGSRPTSLREVELDVREDMRSGREPFSRIMGVIAALGEDEVLRLRTIFEPVPLFGLLAKRGFSHEKARLGADDWSIWFWRSERDPASRGSNEHDTARSDSPVAAQARIGSAAVAAENDAVEGTTVWLDVRGLEPPEPLMRTLAALEALPRGHQLVQINARVPQLLLPMLGERGFACEMDESHSDHVRVRIWRASGD